MADSAIGALSVIIGGDKSALDKMLAGAQSSLSGFAKSVASIATGNLLSKGIESAASAIVGVVQKGLESADQIAKMAQATGVSVEQMSRLKFAADLTGVSSDALKSSLSSLSAGLSSLASGAVTPAANALEAMGLSARNSDGSLKNSGQMIGEIADKFARYKDGAAKAKLAQDLFGAGGEAMIPLLNQGSAGLAQLGDDAARFGAVLDDRTAYAVTTMNDNLRRMDTIKQGLGLTIATKLLPSLQQFSAQLLEARESSSLMTTAAEGISTVFKGIVAVGTTVVVMIQRIKEEFAAVARAFEGFNIFFNAPEAFSKALENLRSEGEKTKTTFDVLGQATSDLFSGRHENWQQQSFDIGYMSDEVQRLGKSWSQTEAPISKATDAVKNALLLYLDSSAKRVASQNAEADAVGKSVGEQARLKVEYEASAIATAKGIALTDEYRRKISEAGEAAANAAARLMGSQVTQQMMTPWEQRAQQLRQYVELLDRGVISLQTFSRASAKLQFPNFVAAAQQANDFQMQVDSLATNMVNGLASAFAQVATGQKSLGEAFGQFAIQFITQIMEMIAKALIYRAIMLAIGFASGGPVGDQGASAVMGFAPGGLVRGPGTSTSDSIPAMLSNGEFVINADATRKWGPVLAAINADRMPRFASGGMVMPTSNASTSPAQVAPSATVHLHGRSYSRADLADLIDGLNGMFRNGYRLKVA